MQCKFFWAVQHFNGILTLNIGDIKEAGVYEDVVNYRLNNQKI